MSDFLIYSRLSRYSRGIVGCWLSRLSVVEEYNLVGNYFTIQLNLPVKIITFLCCSICIYLKLLPFSEFITIFQRSEQYVRLRIFDQQQIKILVASKTYFKAILCVSPKRPNRQRN